MSEILDGLGGTVCLMDDTLVYGTTVDEHDYRLHKVLGRQKQANITLNDKCEFAKTEIKFLGHIVNEDGVKPDPKKTQGITDFPEPKNVNNLRSFLRMVNQLGIFIPNLADKIKVLRDLLSKDNEWV